MNRPLLTHGHASRAVLASVLAVKPKSGRLYADGVIFWHCAAHCEVGAALL